MTNQKKNGWIKFVPSLDLPKERVSIAYDTHDERGYRFAYGYFQFNNGTCSCFWKDGNEQPKVVKVEDIKYWMPVPPFEVQEQPVSEQKLSNVQRFGKIWKEPVSERFAFKAIPRLLEMIEPTDRAKAYIAKLADALEVEGYSTDAKIVMESLKIMNGEKVPMATMDEEPVSEGLEKASKEWLRPQLDKSYANYGEAKMMELTHFDGYAMLDAIEFGASWKDQQFEKNRLKHCNSITNEQAELEQEFIDKHLDKHQRMPTFLDAIEYGMRLREQQMMARAVDGEVGYWNLRGLSVNAKLPRSVNEGDRVKVIVIKED